MVQKYDTSAFGLAELKIMKTYYDDGGQLRTNGDIEEDEDEDEEDGLSDLSSDENLRGNEGNHLTTTK